MSFTDDTNALLDTIQQFFDPAQPYGNKQNLDRVLTAFRTQPDSWRQCALILEQFPALCQQQPKHVDNITWFCLSVYEEMILRRWLMQSAQDQEQIQRSMMQFLGTQHAQLKPYVLNKLVKIIAVIARRAWPDRFPDLFPLLQSMLFDRSTRILALTLLKVVSEEFLSTKTDLNAARKAEIKLKFYQQIVPGIVFTMQRILEESFVHPATTDTLSARQLRPSDSFFDELHISSATNGQPLFTPQSAKEYSSFPREVPPRGHFDAETMDVCQLCLEILLQFFGWIPLNDATVVNASLIATILQFTQMNDASNIALGRLSMACINELLTRNCSPPEFESYLLLIFKHVYEILKSLAVDGDESAIDDLDEEYRLKFTEFVTAFIHLHIHRFENNPNFPMGSFLELLFKFTYRQPSIVSLQECLSIWNRFFDFLLLAKEKGAPIADKYKAGLLVFAKELSKKMYFAENSSDLCELDDDLEDPNGQTEYDQFFNEWMEMLYKCAVLYPAEIVGMLYQQMDGLMNATLAALNRPHKNTSLQDAVQIGFLFKDLRACLRIFGRMSDLFTQSFESTFTPTYQLLQRFLGLISSCLQNFDAYQELPDYVKLTTDSYAAMLSFVPWLVTFQQRARGNPELVQQFDQLCTDIINSCIVCLKPQLPDRLSHVASKVLRSVFVTVKPANLFEYARVGEFLGNIHNISVPMKKDVKQNLYHATSSACLSLLPHSNGGNEQILIQQYQQFVAGITVSFVNLPSMPRFYEDMIRQPEIRSQISHVLVVLAALLESAAEEQTSIKQVLFETIKETLPLMVHLFKAYQDDNAILLEIMSFFVILFKAIPKQLGIESARHVLGSFLQIFDATRLQSVFEKEDVSSAEVVCKFLDLLKIVMEDNSRLFDGLTSDIVQFCIDRAPMTVQHAGMDIGEMLQSSYFPLVHSILLHNWRFFFPTSQNQIAKMKLQFQQQQQNGVGTNGNSVPEKQERVQEFTALLSTFATSFQQPGITVFRNNLGILEDLNLKCRLFVEPNFREGMRASFLQLFLFVLCDKSHDLLRDEIMQTMFQIAATDFAWFYVQFLPTYFIQLPSLTDMQKSEIMASVRKVDDAPSFMEQLGRIVDDVHFFTSTQAQQ